MMNNYFSKNIKSIKQNSAYHCLIIASFLFIMLLSNTGCSGKKQQASISVSLENANRTMSYLIELGYVKEKIIDSARFNRRGKIGYHLNLKNPGYYQIRFENDQLLTLILSPGEKVIITGDYKDLYGSKKIEGSENSIRVNYIQDSLRITLAKLESLKNEYSQLEDSSTEVVSKEKLANEYNSILEGYKRFSMGFILEDINSLANIAVLFQEYTPGYYFFSEGKDLQFYKLVSDSLTKYYPNVKYVKMLNENYQVMYDNFQKQRLLQLTKSVDNCLPDIQVPGKNGQINKLSTYKGKIVLLSFWSVYDKTCNQLNRSMIPVYNKYKGKGFEIYQVSIDKSRDNWLKAVKFEEIPWISVSDTTFPNSNIRWAYNLSALPLNYLISRDQTEILAKNLDSKALDQQLSKVLNK